MQASEQYDTLEMFVSDMDRSLNRELIPLDIWGILEEASFHSLKALSMRSKQSPCIHHCGQIRSDWPFSVAKKGAEPNCGRVVNTTKHEISCFDVTSRNNDTAACLSFADGDREGLVAKSGLI